MKLRAAFDVYLQRRRSAGVKLVSAGQYYKKFCAFAGDINLEDLSLDAIERFVGREGISGATRAANFGALKRFVEHQEKRGIVFAFQLGRAPRPGPRFTPMILTHAQVRALLEAAGRHQDALCTIAPQTLRLMMILLYATGAQLREVIRMRWCDVDARGRRLTLQADGFPARTILFQRDLRNRFVPSPARIANEE